MSNCPNCGVDHNATEETETKVVEHIDLQDISLTDLVEVTEQRLLRVKAYEQHNPMPLVKKAMFDEITLLTTRMGEIRKAEKEMMTDMCKQQMESKDPDDKRTEQEIMMEIREKFAKGEV